MKATAILNGGGPGALNPVNRAYTMIMHEAGYKVYGINKGWGGLTGPTAQFQILTPEIVEDWHLKGGSEIHHSRTNPDKTDYGWINIALNISQLELESLVVCGGEDTLGVANKCLATFPNIIGVPKTHDLDLSGTDYSTGFESYTEAARIAIQNAYVDACASGMVEVVELQGRECGKCATKAAMNSMACFIAIKEIDVDLDLLVARVKDSISRHNGAVVVVGEAIEIEAADTDKIDPSGHKLLADKQVGRFLAKQIEIMTGIQARFTNPGYTLRSSICGYDIFAGTRLGLEAAKLAQAKTFGVMLCFKGNEIITQPIEAGLPQNLITRDTYWSELVQLRNQGKL